MKTLIFLPIMSLFVLLPQSVVAQKNLWHTDQKARLVGYCKLRISESVGRFSNDQKENLCLCVLHDLQNSYTEAEYVNFLREELYRNVNTALRLCYTEHGIAGSQRNDPLAEEPQRYSGPGPVMITNFTRKGVAGMWRFEKSRLWFRNDGTYEWTGDDGRTSFGNWGLENQSIILRKNQDLSSIVMPAIHVVFFDGQALTYKLRSDPNTIHRAHRMSNNTLTWHDLVGQWKDQYSSLTFMWDGTFIIEYDNRREGYLKGQWRFDGQKRAILRTIQEKNFQPANGVLSPMTIIAFDGNGLRYKDSSGAWTAQRQRE